MRKTTLAALLILALLLPGCAQEEGARLTVVCTTYPIYLFASSIAREVEGVAVERLDTGSASCLHDYSLTMADMKKLDRADVIAINGAGLEEFLEDALKTSHAQVIDCSEGIQLLENLSHHHEDGEEDAHGHDHGHWDPHYWMDPKRAAQMTFNLIQGLGEADPDYADDYRWGSSDLLQMLARSHEKVKSSWSYWRQFIPGLITFHDGFQYFADVCGLPLLASIEEEAGSEASAREIVEITELVREYEVPVIFTEANGSDATAQAISRETGCRVAQLDLMMDGPEGDVEAYYDALCGNITAIINGFMGREVVHGP